jgi:hypothetical protein
MSTWASDSESDWVESRRLVANVSRKMARLTGPLRRCATTPARVRRRCLRAADRKRLRPGAEVAPTAALMLHPPARTSSRAVARTSRDELPIMMR